VFTDSNGIKLMFIHHNKLKFLSTQHAGSAAKKLLVLWYHFLFSFADLVPMVIIEFQVFF